MPKMNMRITSIQEEIQKNGNQWQSMAIKQNRIVGFLASLGSKSLLISFLNPNPMESNESKKKKKTPFNKHYLDSAFANREKEKLYINTQLFNQSMFEYPHYISLPMILIT